VNGVYRLDAGNVGHAVADGMLEPLSMEGLIRSVRLTPKFLTQYHLSLPAADPFEEFDPTAVSAESVRNAVIAMHEVRAGQQEFRRRLLDAYGRRCAVSNCAVEEALEAAHIIPDTVVGNAGMDPRNGILLRADIHRLFDCGLIVFRMEGDELRLSISPALEGSEYEQHARQAVRLPDQSNLRPSRRCLERRWEAQPLPTDKSF
jgi:putative restriction endonuclease